MKNVLLIGPPGSNKARAASLFDTGMESLTEAHVVIVNDRIPLHQHDRQYDDLIEQQIREETDREWRIISGYPCRRSQIARLEKILFSMNQRIDLVLAVSGVEKLCINNLINSGMSEDMAKTLYHKRNDRIQSLIRVYGTKPMTKVQRINMDDLSNIAWDEESLHMLLTLMILDGIGKE